MWITRAGAPGYIATVGSVQHFGIDEVHAMTEIGNERWTHPAAILVATNLSDLDRLMPFAFQMAEETGARLQVLHIIPLSAEFTADATGMPYYDREGALYNATNMLQPWCERARTLGLHCDGLVREGHSVAKEVIAAVRHFKADRLILGTRAPGKLGKLLLGSVAEQVLRSVTLPVFTVGPEAHLRTEDNSRQRTVLFATALGEGHRASAALACQIATNQHARLVMLHVLPPIDGRKDTEAPNILYSTIQYEMRHLAKTVNLGHCTDVEIKIVYGNPAIEILAEAKGLQAGLIVIGAARSSMLDSVTRDRTVCRVLAHARCPVLTLHVAADTPEQMELETAVQL